MTCAYGHLSLDYNTTVSDTMQQGIYTDSDLQSQKFRYNMNSCIDELLGDAAKQGLNLTGGADIELVVQLFFKNRTKDLICRYYFVDHTNRLLLWVHEQCTEKLFDGLLGVEKLSHISAPSCSSGKSSCLYNLRLQSMPLNISTGKSGICMFRSSSSVCGILLTAVIIRTCIISANCHFLLHKVALRDVS
jgi:hypothetical protein